VDINAIIELCGVEGYVKGTLLRPDPNIDPEGAENWSYNDAYTRLIISLNVTQSQKMNTSMCNNAREVWNRLEDVNRSQVCKTIFGYKRKLCHTTAGERDNIIEHLDKLKKYRQQVDFAASYNEGFKTSDTSFKQIIALSLPPSWDFFLSRYVKTQTFIDVDHRTVMSTQRFIEVIEQEYRRRDREFSARRWPNHITTMYCSLCKKSNHNTECCRFLGQPRCGACGRFGNDTSDCRNNKGKKRKHDGD